MASDILEEALQQVSDMHCMEWLLAGDMDSCVLVAVDGDHTYLSRQASVRNISAFFLLTWRKSHEFEKQEERSTHRMSTMVFCCYYLSVLEEEAMAIQEEMEDLDRRQEAVRGLSTLDG